MTKTIEQLQARVRELEAENARLKTVPMKYRRMQFNAQLQDENNELRAQLATAQKEIEQLKATPPDKREDLCCVISDLCRQVQDNADGKYLGRICDTSAADKIDELKNELERERMRLAAVGTAALGYFEGCCEEYKSASLDDVLRLRAGYDQLVENAVLRGNELTRLQSELAAVTSERDALKKDAERYRYLRNCESETSAYLVSNMNCGYARETLDSVVDSSIAHDKFYGLYSEAAIDSAKQSEGK